MTPRANLDVSVLLNNLITSFTSLVIEPTTFASLRGIANALDYNPRGSIIHGISTWLNNLHFIWLIKNNFTCTHKLCWCKYVFKRYCYWLSQNACLLMFPCWCALQMLEIQNVVRRIFWFYSSFSRNLNPKKTWWTFQINERCV